MGTPESELAKEVKSMFFRIAKLERQELDEKGRMFANHSQTKGHFYVQSALKWRKGRDPAELIRLFRQEEMPFFLWFVPVDEDTHYEIENREPQVEGAVCVSTYGLTQWDALRPVK